MGRYSDVNRGPELMEAYTKRQAWLALSKDAKKSAYTALNVQRVVIKRQEVYIRPFDSTEANLLLKAKAPIATSDDPGPMLRTILGNTRVVENADPSNDIILTLKPFQFAKLVATKRTNATGTAARSRITDLPYMRYQSDSASCPFGWTGVATDNFSTAVAAIRSDTAFKAFSGTVGNRIGIVPQKSALS